MAKRVSQSIGLAFLGDMATKANKKGFFISFLEKRNFFKYKKLPLVS